MKYVKARHLGIFISNLLINFTYSHTHPFICLPFLIFITKQLVFTLFQLPTYPFKLQHVKKNCKAYILFSPALFLQNSMSNPHHLRPLAAYMSTTMRHNRPRPPPEPPHLFPPTMRPARTTTTLPDRTAPLPPSIAARCTSPNHHLLPQQPHLLRLKLVPSLASLVPIAHCLLLLWLFYLVGYICMLVYTYIVFLVW